MNHTRVHCSSETASMAFHSRNQRTAIPIPIGPRSNSQSSRGERQNAISDIRCNKPVHKLKTCTMKRNRRAELPFVFSFRLYYSAATMFLFECDGFHQVARTIYVEAALGGNIIGKQLQGDDLKNRGQKLGNLGNEDGVVCEPRDRCVSFRR